MPAKKKSAKRAQPILDHDIPRNDAPAPEPTPVPAHPKKPSGKEVLCEYRGPGGKLVRKFADHTKEVVDEG